MKSKFLRHHCNYISLIFSKITFCKGPLHINEFLLKKHENKRILKYNFKSKLK